MEKVEEGEVEAGDHSDREKLNQLRREIVEGQIIVKLMSQGVGVGVLDLSLSLLKQLMLGDMELCEIESICCGLVTSLRVCVEALANDGAQHQQQWVDAIAKILRCVDVARGMVVVAEEEEQEEEGSQQLEFITCCWEFAWVVNKMLSEETERIHLFEFATKCNWMKELGGEVELGKCCDEVRIGEFRVSKKACFKSRGERGAGGGKGVNPYSSTKGGDKKGKGLVAINFSQILQCRYTLEMRK